MNKFLKELKELMEKHEAEIHHNFWNIELYVGNDKIEIDNLINDLSLNDLIEKRNNNDDKINN